MSESQQSSVEVFDDLTRATEALLARILRAAGIAVQRRGRMSLVLSGGNTPAGLYARLGSAAAASMPWNDVEVFFSDERGVAPNDPQSNYGMVERTLLDHVPLPAARVHRIKGELAPERAASAYEDEIRQALALSADAWPRFDVILLGMGSDGHTASLFPYTAALEVTDRIAVANEVPQLQTTRISLTVPALNQAREVIFLAAGADKAEALAGVLCGPFEPRRYPSQLIRPADGPVTWFVDHAAAVALNRSDPSLAITERA